MSNARFQKHGQIVMNRLVYINYLLLELSGVSSAIPTLNEAATYASTPVVSLPKLTNEAAVPDNEAIALQDKIQRLQLDASFQEKAQWVLRDKNAKIKVQTIKQMIEELFLQFPPPVDDSAAPLAANRDLGSDDEKKLESMIRSSTSDPILAALTMLKYERLKLERKADDLRSVDPAVNVAHLIEDHGTGPRRLGAFFNRSKQRYPVPVIIEERVVQNDPDMDAHDHRINSVARLLAMDNKPPEMRLLDCLGVISLGGNFSTTYKLLYKLPARDYFNLKDILARSRKTLPLGMKFSCAKVLARAVLYLHLAGWFHKGIRTNNIVFVADDRDQVDLAEPFICGFEYSRQATSIQESESVDSDAVNNLYRHPDAQGPPTLFRREYQSTYDVYALGMVLLELGSHRSLEGLKMKYEEGMGQGQVWTAGNFKVWIIEAILPDMIPKMGEIYVNVVRSCLEGLKRDDGRSPEETFLLKVVMAIDQCRA